MGMKELGSARGKRQEALKVPRYGGAATVATQQHTLLWEVGGVSAYVSGAYGLVLYGNEPRTEAAVFVKLYQGNLTNTCLNSTNCVLKWGTLKVLPFLSRTVQYRYYQALQIPIDAALP